MADKKSHPFPATASSDLCGSFKKGSKNRWVSLFAEDHIVGIYKNASDPAPADIFFTERMEVIVRTLGGGDTELELKSGGQSISLRLNDDEEIKQKYALRDNFSSDLEVWIAKLDEFEEVKVIREGVDEGGERKLELEEAAVGGDFEGELRATLDEVAQAFNLNLRIDMAENLPKMDTFGKIDAYVVVFDKDGRKHRTPIIKNEYNPKWDYNIRLDVHLNNEVEMIIMDHDSVGDDELAATCSFVPGVLLDQRSLQLELNLAKKSSKKSYLRISTNTVLKQQGEASVYKKDFSKGDIHGFLERKTKYSWKKNYYVLKDGTSRLEYYTNEFTDDFDGCIFLNSYCFTKDLDVIRNDDKKEFSLMTPERSYTLKASSVEDKLKFVEGLAKMYPPASQASIEALSSSSSSLMDLNVGVQAAYSGAIAEGKGVAGSSVSSSALLADNEIVCRVQLLESFFRNEPTVLGLQKRVKQLFHQCLEICPNQRLLFVQEFDALKLGTFQHRIGFVDIHRSLDTTRRHISSITIENQEIHTPSWIESPSVKSLLVRSVSFAVKLTLLDNIFQKLERVDSQGGGPHRHFNQEGTLLERVITGIVADMLCEAERFRKQDAFDLSSLHTQLSCVKQLSEFNWKSKDGCDEFNHAIMEIIFHLRNFINSENVAKRVFFKRPFIRRSMDKSLIEAGKKATGASTDSLKELVNTYKEGGGDEYSPHITSKVAYQSDCQIQTSYVEMRAGQFRSKIRVPREAMMNEMKYKVRDYDHRLALIAEKMAQLKESNGQYGGSVDATNCVPLTGFPNNTFFLCAGINTMNVQH
uniref:C2 domain-containing protein n=1 Tax=Paramoeba aestuarina TaxID=180227 RepID=A0A7S4V0V8_9EUKA